MDILTANDNVVRLHGVIERGVYPEADPSTELYKITNDDGVFHAVIPGHNLYTDVTLPSGFVENQFTYTPETGFVKIKIENLSIEDRLQQHEADLAYLLLLQESTK